MLIQVFFLSFIISLLGTIPPATINISVMQLSLKGRTKNGYYLSLGAAIIDALYGALAVKIQQYLSAQIALTNSFFLIAALVLLTLGVVSIRSKTLSSDVQVIKGERVGFLKGILLGVLNPLAMPFWLGVTTYLKVHEWIVLDGVYYWSYIIGVFAGEITMLIIIVKVGSGFTKLADNQLIVNVIPGVVFLVLGLGHFVKWLVYYL